MRPIVGKIESIVVVGIVLFLTYPREKFNEQHEQDDLTDLLNSVKIESDKNCDYDRDEWTSSYQYYECKDSSHDHNGNDYTGDDDGEFASIRAFSFYESEWYNWEKEAYLDPYTNQWIYDIKEADYDHIIPLAYVNSHGGSEWSESRKKEYADNPMAGVCCLSSLNRSKGAKGPSEWLPEKNVEDYCYSWLYDAVYWDISLDEDDYNTIKSILMDSDGYSNISKIIE